MRRVAIVIVVVFVFAAMLYAQHQLPPSNAQQAGGVPVMYANGSHVNVYINTNSYPQNGPTWQALTAGFRAAASSYVVGVTFNFVGYAGNPPSPSGNYIYVYQTTPTPGPSYEGYTSYSYSLGPGHVDGYIFSAAMQLNPNLSTPAALQTATSHEVSHLYGLGDCAYCGSTLDSLMYNPLPPMNGTVVYYPTNNDSQAQHSYIE